MTDSRSETAATAPGEVSNVLRGTIAGPTVQAGAVYGGVHFHEPATELPAPRQVPAPPAHLVGRAAELAELDRCLAAGGTAPPLAVVTGVGGVGKSALALAWAHRAAARFPDGQLYAQLGAFDPEGPAAPGEPLGRLLRSLGVPAQRVPVETGERSALFRSLAAGRRLLVLLDNAVSAAQVRPLLPASPGCAVLVTARSRLGALATEGARFLPLEPLPADAGAELLARTVGAERTAGEPEATSSLVRLCGGLPIALVVTGARLATRPRWPLRRVAGELAEESRRLHALGGPGEATVRTTFDLSYRGLPAPVARCYRLLGLHPGAEFGVPVVAAGLDVSADEAAELLDALLEANLLGEVGTAGETGAFGETGVAEDPGDERYRMHDLVRLHARQRAVAEPDHALLTRRLLEWYLAGALAADRLLTPYRRGEPEPALTLLAPDAVALADRDAALSFLERERTNLVSAVAAAAPELPLLAWQLAYAMWPLFHHHRHHADRLRVDRLAVRCAQALGDRKREARMLRRLAFGHFDVGRLDEAGELFTRLLSLSRELADRYGQASAYEGLGTVALAQRRYPEAVGHFDRQLRLCRELGERRRCGLALLNLGTVGTESARYREAVAYLREAEAIFAEFGGVDPYNAARVRVELGRALGALGERVSARAELTAALAELRRLDSPRGEAQALHRLGELALAGREFAEARTRLEAASRIYERLGDAEAARVRELTALVPPVDADPDRVPQP
ncbi:tetratricopeptide repeat protein [Micromonospora sp. NPDC049559]|uniref:tetratricopeptide repeat protein n=1 Tax=Micromonospora sp. NPDC049559 TaxID=3155923 RepID=UPI00343B0DBA